MENYFKISTGVTIVILAIFAVFFKPPVILAQSDLGQVNVSVTVTAEAFCNSNGICEAPGENELNCFNDCGCNNNGICELQRGEDVNSCPKDCAVSEGGNGGSGYILEGLYIKNLIISNVTYNSAEISWQTNKSVSCVTNIGKTSGYEKETEIEAEKFSNHLVKLTGLSPSTTYHFNITCKDVDNLTVQTGDKYFITPYIIGDVNNFTAAPGEKEIFLSWENPVDPNFQSVRLIKNEYFYPVDINDGVVIYEGAGSDFIDKNVQAEKIYYYAIYSVGINNVWSPGALAFAQQKLVTAPVAPATLPVTPSTPPVTPIISANKEITITTVNFSAEKINLPIGDSETIEILPNAPLTISIDCGKIPGAEKISVNLQSLKTESSNNFCEVSLIAPQNPGTYPIEILITDSKNRIIGKIDAELKVLGSNKPFLTTGAIALITYILMTLVVIFFTIWFLKRSQKKSQYE